MKKPSFEVSEDVQRLVDYLMANESATYAELSKLVNRDIQFKQRYILVSAQRILERQRNRVFVAERNVGVRLASNGERATLSTTHPISKVRRITGRAATRQKTVNSQALTAEDRLIFDIGRSVLNAIRGTTSQSLRTRLAREIEKQDGGIVSIASVLSLPRHRK